MSIPRYSFKIWTFSPYFKWFWTKWQPFLQISNGWGSGFQIPFQIQTICKFSTIWNTDSAVFQIPTALFRNNFEFKTDLASSDLCLNYRSLEYVQNRVPLSQHRSIFSRLTSLTLLHNEVKNIFGCKTRQLIVPVHFFLECTRPDWAKVCRTSFGCL